MTGGAKESSEEESGRALQGSIDRVTYRHPETHYTVLRVKPERGFGDPASLFAGERATAVGTLADGSELGEGLRVHLRGEWVVHGQHGRQFRFETARVLPPLGREGLVRYLASDTFRGIGPTIAERIVDALGSTALTQIREDPSVLDPIRGLRAEVRAELVRTVQSELGTQETLAFLYGVGLGPGQAARVLRAHGTDAEERLRRNPYLLARGIAGIGFGIADRVARELGVEEDAPIRRQGALLHELSEAAKDGHTLQRASQLATRAGALTNLAEEPAAWRADLETLEREDAVVLEHALHPDDADGPDAGDPAVYLPALHTAERGLARNLAGLVASGPVHALADAKLLADEESRAGIDLHPLQREAVLGVLSEPVALLTGGPGVGKTTIVRTVVELATRRSLRVALASPTGRAAKRLAEATGREARTVHRLLGWEPRTGRFQHDAHTPLEFDLVVVDEISMLDVVLAHHLVKAIAEPTRLLLVGDPNQLPSVSPGNVLADLLASERVPAFRLSHVYRQAAESLIVQNAHALLAGEPPRFATPGEGPQDFFLFPAEDDGDAADRLVDVVSERIPRTFGLDWARDVQVLSPMYRGPCGVDALNERLRDARGVGGRELRWRGRVWRVGDRVIHTRNDYEKNVFNGDMGTLTHVDADGMGLTVRFPEREVRYTTSEFTDLSPAFAITVHRSQGGEFPAIVMPLVTQHFTMLQRHLFYTAITRAKELVVLVGSRRALARAVENAEVAERASGLALRLRELASGQGFLELEPEGDASSPA